MARPKILITQKIFDEAVALVKDHFEVDYNPSDTPLPPSLLVKRLQEIKGAITLLTDSIDEPLLAQCPALKIVSNVAVGYNNIDVEACTRRGVIVTNTPGVLDETTADFTWTLILATARRLVGMTNVVLAPHIASASGETRLRMATMAAENMIAGLMGKRPPNLINERVFPG